MIDFIQASAMQLEPVDHDNREAFKLQTIACRGLRSFLIPVLHDFVLRFGGSLPLTCILRRACYGGRSRLKQHNILKFGASSFNEALANQATPCSKALGCPGLCGKGLGFWGQSLGSLYGG